MARAENRPTPRPLAESGEGRSFTEGRRRTCTEGPTDLTANRRGDLADITTLIHRADGADTAAVDELFAALYGELHRLAEIALRGNGGWVTLGATTLLHEAYLNMSGREGLTFAERGRFLAYAARAMRGLLIDYARRRRARKRGGELEITLNGDETPSEGEGSSPDELARIGEALEELGALEPKLAEVVDLHFFCGFSFVEIAGLREVSERTVQRDWRKARLLLHRILATDALADGA